ncbi:DsbA family protein [Methyloligella sp. 2.7D]|uniref:DsbA family protein n=1 Tax=unclassified Methyloligella TaxID=2625955 RepID=UPI00157BEBBC|nr:DsbA family protein [Methyloligella sp. GL2]QKP77813.1 DsbA family protein [Methyloligella sp. GL2]
MNVKTGLAVAVVAAVVSAAVTAAGLMLTGVIGENKIEMAGGGTVTATPGGLDLSKEEDRQALLDVVHDDLIANPEILVDMSTELDKRQQDAQEAMQKEAIGKNAEKLFRSPRSFTAGNPEGDVTVVEFFDYNCGYCKRALPDVMRLAETDPHVKLVLKDLPIFGEDSEAAARVALAAGKQGKYLEVHQRLFNDPGKANEEKGLEIARDLGLDMDKLKADMTDPSIGATLKENEELAQAIGLQGTPLYLIGDRMIAGAPTDLFDQLENEVDQIRENGCTTTC